MITLRSTAPPPSWFERTVTWATLFFATGIRLPGIPSSAIWAVLYVFIGMLLVLLWARSGKILLPSLPLTAFLVVMTMSILWSELPYESARSVLLQITTTIVAIYLAQRYSMRSLIMLLSRVLAVAVIASVFAAVLLPSIGQEPYPLAGEWRGLFLHKNILARVAVLCFIMWSLRSYYRIGNQMLNIGVLIIALVTIIGADARASYVSLLSVPLLILLLGLIRAHGAGMLGLGAISLGIAIPFIYQLASAFYETAITDRSLLTGRAELWQSVWSSIEARPWLGYGYGGFWHGLEGPSRAVVMDVRDPTWIPPHAHNMILDLWLSTGLVGVVLFVICFVGAWWRAFEAVVRSARIEADFAFVILTFIFIHGATERVMPAYNNIYWILFVVLVLWRPSSTGATIQDVESESAPVAPHGRGYATNPA